MDYAKSIQERRYRIAQLRQQLLSAEYELEELLDFAELLNLE